jgi:hypothetical protein
VIYLMMADQTFQEVPGAATARIEGDQVVCFDISGAPIATFDAPSVSAFGKHEALRAPAAGVDPVGGGVRREREMSEAPLSSVRLAMST